jgi:hypothetical protein
MEKKQGMQIGGKEEERERTGNKKCMKGLNKTQKNCLLE